MYWNNVSICQNNFPTCQNNFPTCHNYFLTCLINFPTNKWIQKKSVPPTRGPERSFRCLDFCPNMSLGVVKNGGGKWKKWACNSNFREPNFLEFCLKWWRKELFLHFYIWHMGMSYLTSLNPQLFKNIAYVGSFKHFLFNFFLHEFCNSTKSIAQQWTPKAMFTEDFTEFSKF